MLDTVQVLGIDVPEPLVGRWRRSLAPEWQPFFVDAGDEWAPMRPAAAPPLTADLRDTYTVWRLQGAREVIWLDEASFLSMPRADRARLVRAQVHRGRGAVPTVRRWAGTFDRSLLREQADGHRFVWWPSLVDQHPEAVLADHIQDGQPASRHREVRPDTWRSCRAVLPEVRSLAGTFAASSSANCFGTTLAAAGQGDEGEQVEEGAFEDFLAAHCIPGGDDRAPGTVLVWRDRDGRPCHSAVTIGDGWAFEKPSQTWWTPRVVLEIRQLIGVNRSTGRRLERHRLLRT